MTARSIHPSATIETLAAHLQRLENTQAYIACLEAQVGCVAAFTGDLDRFNSHDPATCKLCLSEDGAKVHHARTDAEMSRYKSTLIMAEMTVRLFVSAWGPDGLPYFSAEIERASMKAMRPDEGVEG